MCSPPDRGKPFLPNRCRAMARGSRDDGAGWEHQAYHYDLCLGLVSAHGALKVWIDARSVYSVVAYVAMKSGLGDWDASLLGLGSHPRLWLGVQQPSVSCETPTHAKRQSIALRMRSPHRKAPRAQQSFC